MDGWMDGWMGGWMDRYMYDIHAYGPAQEMQLNSVNILY